jgi:ubiquitin-like 1-activating enzyme E1 A
VLLININGLGAEIAKNLVLSGVNTLVVLDSNLITSEDLKGNFLADRNSIGKNVSLLFFFLLFHTSYIFAVF